ncbi:MAG: SPFH/Band 7/PHB domain protein [Caulobacterales bacterium]|nr:SPFH/Band 7/PHB domain protein [Caulobacterales bacterium]MCA0373333.1 SPFH/Band 7/PHB domain protein [Pseudomonadota bacterium]
MGSTIFAIVLLVLGISFVASTIKIVPQGYQFTVERFGKFTRILPPGISFLVPFIDTVGRKISMMEAVFDVQRQEVITRDNAMVSCDAVVFTQVYDAAKAAYEVENLRLAISNLVLTNLRTVVGSLELDEVLSQRDQINSKLLQTIDAATSPWGIKVVRIEIKDITPPANLLEAMARQMKAERDKRAEITEAEGSRAAAILRAEGLKQSTILEAEARKEAAYRDAEARERSAEAEANATTMVSEAIAKGDVQAINYFLAQKYIEAFGKLATSPQQKTLIVPADFSGIAGTVEGIKSLLDKGDK